MTIKVLPEIVQTTSHYISPQEAVLVKKIYIAFGRIDAVRVARAFAQCSLKDAVDYVDSIPAQMNADNARR